ncbi:uncharacterized protein LOC131072165 [Cryptomeria japonica]|uniref:uncharacterized protein LOC131072165 n=1 Tax=Cryptomeria japonica TaxID=3369 RepID=UPI0027DA66A8|nr:uncharacterized protein LOC131072165 [Cryptomeria japonica]
MVGCGHGLEIINLKEIVSQICEGRPTPFKDGMPGNSWWFGFKAKYHELSLRMTEGLDKDQALCLIPIVVYAFYETLSKAHAANPYGPARIWNYDETRVMTNKNGAMRVLAKKGSRNMSYILVKRHELITVLCSMNASKQSIPRFYLFNGKRQTHNYIAKCEPGACMAAQKHSWMTKKLFMSWLNHFKHSIPRGVSPTNRCLLIFDGHDSRVAFPTIQEARMLGIDLLTLPTHTSHKLQPLDVSVFSPFKTYFKSERAAWIERFPNLEIRRGELTVSNITARFKRTGIWPLNPDALTQDMQPNTTFHINDEEDASAVQNMLSLLRVHVSPEVVAKNIATSYQMDSTTQVGMEQTTTNIDEAAIDTLDESLGLPSERIAPPWVVEGATILNVELEGEDEWGTSILPSPSKYAIPEMVHYYADCGYSDNENDAGLTQEATQDCNVEEESLMSQVSETPQSQQQNTLL